MPENTTVLPPGATAKWTPGSSSASPTPSTSKEVATNGPGESVERARPTGIMVTIVTSATTPAPVAAHSSGRHLEPGRTPSLSAPGRGSFAASSISMRATAAESSRRFGSFSRQRCSNRRTAAGVLTGSSCQSGSCSMILTSTSESVSPANARCPVSISNSTQPNAQTSVRLSTASPRACSGLM